MQKRFNETLFTPILIIVIFTLIIAANFIPKDTLGMDDNPYLAAVAIQLLTYALPALFYCRIRGRDFTGKLRLRFFPPSQLLYLFYAFGKIYRRNLLGYSINYLDSLRNTYVTCQIVRKGTSVQDIQFFRYMNLACQKLARLERTPTEIYKTRRLYRSTFPFHIPKKK